MEKDEILENIIKKYNLKKAQAIDYAFFNQMYQEYKDQMSDQEFAELLQISKVAYQNFKSDSKKNPNRMIIILKDRNLSEVEKQKNVLQLVQIYKLYKGQKIDYVFFTQMHEKVQAWLTEAELSNLFGISDTNLRNIRREGTARLFRNMKLNEESIEKIRKSIIEQNEGKGIYYKQNEQNKGSVDFFELYNPYRIYFSHNEFATLLGISEKNLWYAMHNMANPKIKDTEKVKKVEQIKQEIVEGKYYSKEELERLCKQVNLSIDDFITYYINHGDFFDSSVYKDVIEHNQKLWIGRTKIENSDLEKYKAILEHILGTIVNQIQRRYGDYHLEEDLKSSMLVYIAYNCGDLINNFQYDEKVMERMIWTRARKYAQITYIQEYKKERKQVELLDNRIASDISAEQMQSIIDVDEICTEEERLISIFKNYLQQGYDKETIIENVSKTFHIEKTDMLEMMKKYLLEHGKVVKNKRGEYEVGEQ